MGRNPSLGCGNAGRGRAAKPHDGPASGPTPRRIRSEAGKPYAVGGSTHTLRQSQMLAGVLSRGILHTEGEGYAMVR